MVKNREVFLRDPLTFTIPNEGVTKVTNPDTQAEWDVLRYELSNFVCDGEYREGMERVLSTYLSHLHRAEQPAVWVSGFYGSGKSHFVRVLEYIWRDVRFPDGVQARGLVRLPSDIEDLLKELSTAGAREGGLWSAAGKLGAGSGSIRLALLSIIFQQAGLPTKLATAQFVIWLKKERLFDAVMANLAARSANVAKQLNNMYVSPTLAESLLEARPGLADSPQDVLKQLREQFPQKQEIDDYEMLDTIDDVLQLMSTTPGKWPCTLLVFDELQQFINDDAERILQVQNIVEACSSKFGSQLLVVGTGQAALEASPQLSKLQARFTVRVMLSDRDVEQVVREVVLRKAPDKTKDIQNVLDIASGEINRHLAGTKIAPTQADNKDLVPDYPLLPTRRRFWERVLRELDRAGTAAQLRTQLSIVHEAIRKVANDPLGTVAPADFIYDQLRSAMLQSGVLLREVATLISDLDDGTANGRLRSRLCALIFLIGELPTEGVAFAGVRTDADTLADLLVQDLPAGSASLRQHVPSILDGLVEAGTLMLVEGEYRLQTRESAEWERERRGHYQRIIADETRLASERATEFRSAVSTALKGIKLLQGNSNTPRKYELFFGQDMPAADTNSVPVWVRNEWDVSEKTVREDAQAAGIDSPVIFVLLPRRDADALKNTLANHGAATETLATRPSAQSTDEGISARRAMQTRQEMERVRLDGLVAGIVDKARIYQGGGNEIAGTSFRASMESAMNAALVRLFPNFAMADDSRWAMVRTRASQGAGDALSAIGYTGEVAQHPVCRELLDEMGAQGKTGSDIRKRFTGAGYGWPQDAVDGGLLALMAANLVEATGKNGKGLAVKEIAQSQIGVIRFRRTSVVVSASQRIQVRNVLAALGCPTKSGEEISIIPRALQVLLNVAQEAGGNAPLPARPSTEQIEELLAMSGNEQLMGVYENRQELRDSFTSWSQLKARKTERLPRWEKLQRFLAHAANRPITARLRLQVEAIERDRMLLNDPDPVEPLYEELTTDLRAAVTAARQAVVDARDRELAKLRATAEWTKLKDEDWKRVFQANGLSPVDELNVGTDELLLRALDEKPLEAWKTEAVAIPTRLQAAREQAAKMLEPKAVRVRPKSATLHTPAEVDAYINELRAEIIEYVNDGKPVIM